MDTAQRRAWNEAMRTAAGSSGLALPTTISRRYSDRRKKQSRREKARKSSPDDTSTTNLEYRRAVRLDALEGIVERDEDAAAADDDDDVFDEFDEADTATTTTTGRSSSKRRRQSRSGGAAAAAAVTPKRLKARSLASILVEEAGRSDGVTKDYLEAEARTTVVSRKPGRKFCPVTGLFGSYTDPKSGVPFASLKALEQIRERAPPWMSLGGSAAYSEAVKSLRDED